MEETRIGWKKIGVISVMVVMAAMLIVWANKRTEKKMGQTYSATTAQPVVFTVPQLPIEGPVLKGPQRGYYKWSGNETIPDYAPALDAYKRYDWNKLETSKDVYAFDTTIGNDIRAAIAAGQKFGFRTRGMTGKNTESVLPGYMKNTPECIITSGESIKIPVWDAVGDNCFRARAPLLMTELAKYLRTQDYMKYISWVDIGMYGAYGEWYCGWCASQASDPTLKEIVDMHVNNFPEVQLVMMAKTDTGYPLEYALGLTGPNQKPIGWRVDCLGKPGYMQSFETEPRYAAAWAVMQTRWQTAPVITEYCYTVLDITSVEQDVPMYHVSMLSNGNFGIPWSNFSTADKQRMIGVGKIAGQRLGLVTVETTSPWTTGEVVPMKLSWSNGGDSPIYESWDVYIVLRQNGVKTWEVKINRNLKEIMPGQATWDETMGVLPAPDGNYDLLVKVVDPAGVRAPLPLANAGRTGDGEYPVGMIQVGEITTATPTPGVQTLTITAEADARVQAANPNSNYGTATALKTDGSPIIVSYLRFNLNQPALVGKTITSAVLKLRINDASPDAQIAKRLMDENNAWGETTIKYSNRPGVGVGIASFTANCTSCTIDVDVTGEAARRAGLKLNLAIDTVGMDVMAFKSREASTYKPQLVIQYQ